MTNDKILMSLITAIGYALDNKKNANERKDATAKAEKLLAKCMEFLQQRNPPERKR